MCSCRFAPVLKQFFFLLLVLGLGPLVSPLQAQNDSITGDSVYLNNLYIAGNKKTKPFIILREFTFLPRQWFNKKELAEKIERSRSNLMNTALFNFVDVEPEYIGDTMNLTMRVTERWYIWPAPEFEFVDPNFNTWLKTKDLSRTSYGFNVTQYNFRGRNETLRLRVKFGYNQQYSLTYEIPYLDKQRKLGVGLYLSYYQNYQVNTATEDNKRIFFTLPGGVSREEFSASYRLQYRPANYARHYFITKFNSVLVRDSLARTFPDYLADGLNSRKFLEFGYQFNYDKRDYTPYPLVGKFYNLSLSKPDINLSKGKATNVFFTYAQMKRYFRLTDALYYAYSLTGKYTFYKTLPYYFQRGLGYSDFVRGYEYYVIDAQHYAIAKNSFKVRLLERKEYKIGFIGTEKFNRIFLASFLNFNVDVAYARDQLYANTNFLANRLLIGGGVGLDLISFYDVVFRLEYSLNHLGQSGFFVHFSRPI